MTDDRAAFFANIREHPHDDLPRLVYADWLEEQGDEARAEFIRLECELARLEEDDPNYRSLENRRHELLCIHESDWLGDLDEFKEWFFRRGFVDEVRMDLSDQQPVHLGEHFVTSIVVQDSTTGLGSSEWEALLQRRLEYDWPTEIVELDFSPLQLASSVSLGPVLERWVGDTPKRLTLPACGSGGEIAELLQTASLVTRLARLNIGPFAGYGQGFERFDFAGLAKLLSQSQLETLVLSEVELNDDDLAKMLEAAPERLSELDISYNSIAPFAFHAFTQNQHLKLEKLNISGTPLGVFRLREILQADACASLSTLRLDSTGSARPNLEAILGTPFWSQARTLSLRHSTVPAVALEPLGESIGPPRLRRLDLGNNYVGNQGVTILAQAPWTKSLVWLALDHDYLDDDAIPALAQGFPALRTLNLAGNSLAQREATEQLTARGVQQLVKLRGLPNLRVLNLSENQIDDAAAEAILTTDHWQLSGLALAGCPLSARFIQFLAQSPALARLEWLDLSRCPTLGGDALYALAKSPWLSPLCELSIHGTAVSELVRGMLFDRLGNRLS